METSTPDGGAVALERIAVPAWAWLVTAFAVLAVYALTMENGATLQAGAGFLHELFHDGRHLLGVPCH
ncbi:MAG TPA: hypothetical protein VM388_13825 [Acidimicrobiales bacterium]|nr:hypothetical protein [Acidimicrobiales bacterium]HWI05854.1 hypothetical protein [Acidimicrobiales bacterium]